jgi:hypothetical protein
MKISAVVTIWTILAIAICTGVTLGICISQWQNAIISMWSETASQAEGSVRRVIEDHLNNSQFVANYVPLNSRPEELLQYFRQFDESGGYRYTSMGYLRSGTGPNSKLSWQIAKYYTACPYLGYFYSDNLTNPAFYGYCANTSAVNFGNRTYSGFDWGLKPQEAQLLQGSLGLTYLPIFNLLGSFTLTCEVARLPFVAFAELDLNTLTTYFSSNILILNGLGNSYVVESSTGLMIASTVAGTVVSGGERLFAFNSSSPIVRETYNNTQPNSKWLISNFQTTRTGLDWITYVVVLKSDVYGNLYYSVMVAGLICMSVALVMIGLTLLGTFCWITKPIRHLAAKRNGDPSGPVYTPISDFDVLSV